MNAAELDALLRQFLVDHKLNPHEKKVLVDWVDRNVTSEHYRGLARNRLFESVRDAATDSKTIMLLKFIEDVLKVLMPMASNIAGTPQPDGVYFSPGDACLNQILARFNGARSRADVCVFTITDDRITRAILKAQQRGVQLRIITDNDKSEDLGSDAQQLRNAGVPLRMDRTEYHMHHKFAIFDGLRLLNGSYNWTRGAAEQNEENITDTSSPEMIASFQKEFDTLWDRFA